MADEQDGVQPDADFARREEFMRGLVAATPTAYVAPLLIAANVAVFAAMLMRGVSPIAPAADALIEWGANYGPLTIRGQWWRLLTAAFLHGGAIHLLMNMAVLWTAGRYTEQLFGHIGFTVLYALTGLAGSLTSLIWHPIAVSVGASGAVFGLYGGVLGFLLLQRHAIPLDVLAGLMKGGALFLVVNLVYGFTQPQIDMAAHVGGLVAGLPIGCALAVAPGATLPAARRWRSALVAVAGVALAGAVLLRVPIVDDWPAEVARLSALDRENLTRFNGSLDQVRSKAMTREDFARVVEKELLPPWEAQREKMAALRLPEPYRTTSRGVVAFMALRAEAMRLTAEGYRTNSAEMVKQGNLKQEAAVKALHAAMPSAALEREIAALAARRQAAEVVEAGLQRALTAETTALKTYNGALEEFRAGKITRDQFAETIERDVLPPWLEERDALSALDTTAAQPARVKQMIEYMSLRGEAWRLAARAIRTNDPALAQQASAKHTEASNVAKSGGSPADSGD